MENETIEETINYGIPLNGNILVKRTEDVKAMVGGIHIPENAQTKPSEGIVLCVGKPKITDYGYSVPQNLKVGDRVLFGKYVGTEIEIDGQEYMIIQEDKIAMILPQKTEEQKMKDEEAKAERSLILQ